MGHVLPVSGGEVLP